MGGEFNIFICENLSNLRVSAHYYSEAALYECKSFERKFAKKKYVYQIKEIKKQKYKRSAWID